MTTALSTRSAGNSPEDSGVKGVSVDEIARGNREGERESARRAAGILFSGGERGIAQAGGAWMLRALKDLLCQSKRLSFDPVGSCGRRLCRGLKNKANTQSMLLRVLDDRWRGLYLEEGD